jgi:SAM-dependent methyltransferase
VQKLKGFARKYLPKSMVNLLGKLLGRNRFPPLGEYSSIELTDEDIEKGKYKEYLGGGAESWESRGAFQLYFLKKMGLLETSRVLDVGCGPGRAGKHLIEFLESNKYYGVDYNADFIKAARTMSEQNNLGVKDPVFEVLQDFAFDRIDRVFDYAIVFSVLNHCTNEQRNTFFRMIPGPLKEGGKVYITHATWFDESYIEGSGMKRTNQFDADDFDITEFGWSAKDEISPIIELTKY